MARLRRLLNVLVIVIGAIIVWNERRDPARRPARTAGGTNPSPPSPPAEVESLPPATSPTPAPAVDEAAVVEAVAETPPAGDVALSGADELAERQEIAAEARFSPGPPTSLQAEAAGAGPATAEPTSPPSSADAAPVRPDPTALPAGAVAGDGTPTCPPDHPIKGNASSMIYHRPGQPSYERTVAEYCFASEQHAEAAGYRPPRR